MTPLFIIVLIIAIIFVIAFFNLKSNSKNARASFIRSYNDIQNLYQDAKRSLLQCESAKIAAVKQAELLQETLDAHLAKCTCDKPTEESSEQPEIKEDILKEEKAPNSEAIPEVIEAVSAEKPATPVPVKTRPRVSHRRVKK